MVVVGIRCGICGYEDKESNIKPENGDKCPNCGQSNQWQMIGAMYNNKGCYFGGVKTYNSLNCSDMNICTGEPIITYENHIKHLKLIEKLTKKR